jgi:hypothetical protein
MRLSFKSDMYFGEDDSRSQMPSSSQQRNRRCAVRPEQPSSSGTSSQRQPATSTNQITCRTVRCGIGGRPPLGPTGCSGGK